MIPEIKYNLHDSTIISAKYRDDKFELEIALYSIFYPNKEKIRVIFSGLYTKNKVKNLYDELYSESDGDEWLGARIDALYYDQKIKSKKDDLYIYISVDWVKPFVIHCKCIEFVKEGNY